MADVRIKSENQSGGVTAQNVNTTVDQFNSNNPSPSEGPARKIFWWIFGFAGVVGAIAAIIRLFR